MEVNDKYMLSYEDVSLLGGGFLLASLLLLKKLHFLLEIQAWIAAVRSLLEHFLESINSRTPKGDTFIPKMLNYVCSPSTIEVA